MTAQTESPQPANTVDREELAQELEQLSELATLVLSARDALSDDIVSRVASALSEGITLLDRLTRNEGLMRLLQVLDRPETQHLLHGLSTALSQMSREIAISPPAKGGLGGVSNWRWSPARKRVCDRFRCWVSIGATACVNCTVRAAAIEQKSC